LVINGDTREVAEVYNVAELIAALGLPAPAMLVEHNGVALRREEWPASALTDGDQIEVVRIVAGG
jgi:sulfur carrier protein